MKRYLNILLVPLLAVMLASPATAYEWLDETKTVPPSVSDVPVWRQYRLTEDGEASAWFVCENFLQSLDLMDEYNARTCAEQVAELSDLRYEEDMRRVTKETILWGPAPENTRADVLARHDGRDAGGDAALVLDPEKLSELLGLAEDVEATADGLAALGDEVGEHATAIEELGEDVGEYLARIDGLDDGQRALNGTVDAHGDRLDAVEGVVGDVADDVRSAFSRLDDVDRRIAELETAPVPTTEEAEPAPEPEAAPADEPVESAWWEYLAPWQWFYFLGVLIFVILVLWLFLRSTRRKKEREGKQEERPEEEPGPRATRVEHDALDRRVGELAGELDGLTTRIGELEGGHDKLGRRISAAQGMTTKVGNKLGGRIDGLEKRVDTAEGMIKLIFTVITDGARIVGELPSDEQIRSLDVGESIELGIARQGSPDRRTLLIRRDQEGYKLLGLADREEVAFNGTFSGLRKVLGRALRRDAQDPGTVIIGVEKEPAAA